MSTPNSLHRRVSPYRSLEKREAPPVIIQITPVNLFEDSKSDNDSRQYTNGRCSSWKTLFSSLFIYTFLALPIVFILTFHFSNEIHGISYLRDAPYGESRTPRVFYLDQQLRSLKWKPTISRIVFEEDQTIFYRLTTTDEEEIVMEENGECVPMAEWQKMSFPTCNTIHEEDLQEQQTILLGRGGVRNVWRVDPSDGSPSEAVLKTLRTHLNYDEKSFDSQNKDALVMERLTPSKNVVNVYAYCGQSALNELVYTRSLNKAQKGLSIKRKLLFARDAAQALADVHSVDGERTTIAHRDVAASNFVLSRDGKKLLINDFNSCRLLKWNTTSEKSCGFYRQDCNDYRSPEECNGEVLTEKIDIYALGNVLYKLWTGVEPYHYPERFTLEEKMVLITNKIYPPVPRKYQKSKEPEARAMLKAIKKCFKFDPEERPTAQEIAYDLNAAIRTMDWYSSRYHN